MKKIFVLAASLCLTVSVSAGAWDDVQATKEAVLKKCLVSGIKFYMKAEDAFERVQEKCPDIVKNVAFRVKQLSYDAGCVACMAAAVGAGVGLTYLTFESASRFPMCPPVRYVSKAERMAPFLMLLGIGFAGAVCSNMIEKIQQNHGY